MFLPKLPYATCYTELQPPALEYRNGVILGYYIGYQETNVASQLQVLSKDIDPDTDDPEEEVSVVIPNLKKFTEYLVHVKSYNKIGPGPASPDVKVMTLEDGKFYWLIHSNLFSPCVFIWNSCHKCYRRFKYCRKI